MKRQESPPPAPSPLGGEGRGEGFSLGKHIVRGVCLVLLCLFPSPSAVAQNDLQTGVRLFEAGQLVKARQFFETLRQQQPTNTSASFYLGRIAFAEKNYEQAIPWFEVAVDGEQCNADYHLWLGRAYGHHARQVSLFRKPALARKVHLHFEKAVGCDPTHLAAHWDLMEYYLKAPGFLGGSRKKAEEQVAIITRLAPAEGQKARQFVTEWD